MKVEESQKVLLVDDDQTLLEVMSMKLRHVGYEAEGVSNSSTGYQMATNGTYDVIVLDVTMPGRSGLDICRDLRAQGNFTPILILSGHIDKVHIVRGLELGADDYLTKPFSYNELSARLQALVRRGHKNFAMRRISQCGLSLDLNSCIASYDGKSTVLTRKEVLLLKRLMAESPSPISRYTLLKDVWGIDDLHTSNRLDVYIKRLRLKLLTLTDQALIHTVRGSGYYFSATRLF